jgi:hypothetical protein
MVKIGGVKWLTLGYGPDEQTGWPKHPFYLPDCHEWRMQMLQDCIGKNAIKNVITKGNRVGVCQQIS